MLDRDFAILLMAFSVTGCGPENDLRDRIVRAQHVEARDHARDAVQRDHAANSSMNDACCVFGGIGTDDDGGLNDKGISNMVDLMNA
ncbi:MAG: hypothetical protein P0Y59_21770 [Candidatus Sphingomonas phytovorans]|nr:hypothetical protein [Sphingomonas sp.]WEJ99508.1 MAG: hypothetical protein P0Y59_21770 [Sphingomonas sp.]